MLLHELEELLGYTALHSENRPIRLHLAPAREETHAALYVQQINGIEGIGQGRYYQLQCVSTEAGIPLKHFIGRPAEIQYVTDSGSLQTISGIITQAQEGAGDGELAAYRLVLQDAFSAIISQRISSRVFRKMNEVEITEAVLTGWTRKSGLIGACLKIDTSRIKKEYPQREFTLQYNESDSAFLQRLWARRGISWVIESGPESGGNDTPYHTLILFDMSSLLPQNTAQSLRFHRAAATETLDTVTVFSPVRTVVPGKVTRASWDYHPSKTYSKNCDNQNKQNDPGFGVSYAIEDYIIESPHYADSNEDQDKKTILRIELHEQKAKHFVAQSSCRTLTAGTWFGLTDHYEIDSHPAIEREFVVLQIATFARNNLPYNLEARVAQLFTQSRWHERPILEGVPFAGDGWVADLLTKTAEFKATHGTNDKQRGISDDPFVKDGQRHLNRFTCIRRTIPLVPDYNPVRDLPRIPPLSAIVVGPPEQEVWCDNEGRIKIYFPGLRPEDHERAGGAGATQTDVDSAWVRVVTPNAGENFGVSHLPRVGTEVLVVFINGDPDKPIVIGNIHNGTHTPPTFTHVGELPGNRFMSGIRSKEVGGQRYNQLKIDDSPGEISAQLASEHAHTQLNLGFLTHPRADGKAEARGEGAEVRTDAAAAVRAQTGILISTDPRPGATDSHLSRGELLGLLKALQSIQTEVAKLAEKHHAEPGDAEPLKELIKNLENWKLDGGAPVIAVSSQDSLTAMSQNAISLGAQSSIDTISGSDTQMSAGKKLLFRAQQGLTAFAHTLGMKLISASGKLQIEAHKDEIEITSAKKIILSAKEEIVLNAPMIRQTAQGAQIKLGSGSIVGQASGGITMKTSQFTVTGPSGATPEEVNMPKSELETQEQFRVVDVVGDPVVNRRYQIKLSNGEVIEGVTDAQGKTQLIERDEFLGAELKLLD